MNNDLIEKARRIADNGFFPLYEQGEVNILLTPNGTVQQVAGMRTADIRGRLHSLPTIQEAVDYRDMPYIDFLSHQAKRAGCAASFRAVRGVLVSLDEAYGKEVLLTRPCRSPVAEVGRKTLALAFGYAASKSRWNDFRTEAQVNLIQIDALRSVLRDRDPG